MPKTDESSRPTGSPLNQGSLQGTPAAQHAGQTLRIEGEPYRGGVPAGQQTAKPSKLGWVIGIGCLVAFVGFMGMRVAQTANKNKAVAAQREVSAAEAKKPVEFEAIRPEPIKWQPRVEISGTLKPWREADLSFETQGRLVKVGATLGEAVKAGRLLATLDASRAGAQVNQAQAQTRAAQANLALAEDNLKRTETLVASKSIPEAQAEQARQSVALARAQLEAAQATTRVAVVGAGVHSLTAPFDGLVTRAPSNAGAVVNPGMPVFRMEDISRLRLTATVGEEEVDLVARGATVDIQYRDRTLKGTVNALVPSLDPATRRAPIEIEVPNNDPNAPVLGYGFVRASIGARQEVDALKVKHAARRPGSQDELVVADMVAGQGKVRIVRVVHATDAEGNWIVRSGLRGDEQLIVNPSTDMKDGDEVHLKAAQK